MALMRSILLLAVATQKVKEGSNPKIGLISLKTIVFILKRKAKILKCREKT